MYLKLLFRVLLLTQFVSGCMTSTVREKVGYNDDQLEKFSKVYSDGEHVIVIYTVKENETKSTGKRWAEIEVSSLNWVPDNGISGINGVIEGMTFYEFTPRKGEFKSKSGEVLKEISFYSEINSHVVKHTNPESEPIDRDQITMASLHKSDGMNSPFTAFERGKSLILIRNDINKSGHLEATWLAPKKDLHPIYRWALYPFSAVLDVLTFPIQFIFFAIYSGA
jgi:hypothetical protein